MLGFICTTGFLENGLNNADQDEDHSNDKQNVNPPPYHEDPQDTQEPQNNEDDRNE